MTSLFLYRGPFEPRWLAYVLTAVGARYGPPRFVWLVPAALTQGQAREKLDAFFASSPLVDSYYAVGGRLSSIPGSIIDVQRHLRATPGPLVVAGFSTLMYAMTSTRRPLVWFVNGIPEERLLSWNTPANRARVAAFWRALRLVRRPDLAVTVSEPMARLVRERLGPLRTFAAPTCVDLSVFTPQHYGPRRYVTYLGSGAPWQGIERLSAVWQAMARRDQTLQFRVISRDPRTRAIARGLAAGAVDFRSSIDASVIAHHLWEAESGFLLREDNLANEVSMPTKLGEYVAAGAYVVTSDFGWDVRTIVRETGCGHLCAPDASVDEIADQVIAFRAGVHSSDDMADRCRRAAERLSYAYWISRIAAVLPDPDSIIGEQRAGGTNGSSTAVQG